MGRRTKRTLPGTASETWAYDYPDGGPVEPVPNKKWNKVLHQDFGGASTVTEYDSRGRLKHKQAGSRVLADYQFAL